MKKPDVTIGLINWTPLPEDDRREDQAFMVLGLGAAILDIGIILLALACLFFAEPSVSRWLAGLLK